MNISDQGAPICRNREAEILEEIHNTVCGRGWAGHGEYSRLTLASQRNTPGIELLADVAVKARDLGELFSRDCNCFL